MNLESLLQLLNGPDLKSKLDAFVEIYKGQSWFLALLVFGFVLMGRKVVSGAPTVRKNGMRLGLATFLVFVGYEYWRAGNFEDKKRLTEVALQAFSAGGAVTAVVWIVVPVTTFVYTHLRVALAALLGSAGYSLFWTTDEPAEMGIRAGIVVAVALVIAWILHPIWDYIRDLLPKPKARPAREETVEEDEEEEPSRRRDKAEVRPAEPVPVPVPVTVPSPSAAQPMLSVQMPMAAPVEVVSAHLEVVSTQQSEDQRRRDRIRLQIEMAYVMSTPNLGSRLPREAFNELLQRYLGEHLPLSDVEENSRQLLIILQDQQKQTQGPLVPPTPTLTSLALLTPQIPAPAPAPVTVPASALEELLRRLLEEQRRVVVSEARFPDSADHAAANNHHPAPNSGSAANGTHPS